MYKIDAVIRPHKLHDVKDALVNAEIAGMTITEVKGFGKQLGKQQFYRGVPVVAEFIDKVKLEIIVSSEEWLNKAIAIVKEKAYTGEPGDGKIFITEIKKVIRIRTGEEDKNAL